MPERPRSKVIPVGLVYVDSEFIEQALVHMRITKSSNVTLMVANNICIGIETANLDRVTAIAQLPHESAPLQIAAPAKTKTKGLDQITEEAVFDAMKTLNSGETKSATTKMVANHLGLPMSDIAQRAKVGRIMSKMRLSGVLKGVRGGSGKLTLTGKLVKKPQVKTQVKGSVNVTPDAVLKALGDNHLATMLISDRLGLSREDNPSRVKVADIITTLREQNKVEIVERSGNIIVYKAVTASAVPLNDSTG